MALTSKLLVGSVWCAAVLGACGFESQPARLSPSLGGGAAAGAGATPVAKPRVSKPKVTEEEDSGDSSEPDPEPMGAATAKPNPMSCPSCDDHDACTADRSVSRAGKCACENEPILDAEDGDGCCPAGADSISDLDCTGKAECGNGRVDADAGEQCDGGARCSATCTLLFDMSLVHRYSFDGEGVVVADSIGDADGKVVKGMLTGTGELALSGGPANAYAELPGGLIKGLSSATIEIWATIVRSSGGQRLFDFGNTDANGDPTSYWALTPASIVDGNALMLLNLTPQYDFAGGDQTLGSRSAVSSGRVHSIAVTVDGASSMMALYIDGQSEGSTRFTRQLSQLDDAHLWLGRAQYADYPYFNGRITEVRIYNRALSRAEIAANFKAGPDPSP